MNIFFASKKRMVLPSSYIKIDIYGYVIVVFLVKEALNKLPKQGISNSL